MTHITTIGNNKGGPGKTSACVHLGCALARRRKRVLLIDMDPQGNLTRRAVAQMTSDTPTVSEVLKSAAPGCAADAIVACGFDTDYSSRMSIIGADKDLTNRASEHHVLGALTRLRDSLEGAVDQFDVVLIDTPPSLGLLTQMALAASNDVLIVVQPEQDAMEGAADLTDFVVSKASKLGVPDLTVLGYIPSMVRMVLGVHKERLSQMPETFSVEKVWEPGIPDRSTVKEAHESDPPVPVELARNRKEGRWIAGLYDALADRYLADAGLL